MVNTKLAAHADPLRQAARLIGVYIALVAATIVALAALSGTAPDQAGSDAWGHAVIVAIFALALPLRLRAARRGSERASRAVAIIAAVLLVVNVVEAALPGIFPVWMRVEMVGIAALMAAVVASVARARRG